MNLFTRRWSPIRSVFSIEPVGILNAWRAKVVPKMARMTVTTKDSKVSRVDDFLTISSMCFGLPPQLFQNQPGRFLFRNFLAAAAPTGDKIVACQGLHRKGFLMLRAGFLNHSIFGRRGSLRLQMHLKGRFV